jgi:glyoxylase-like metal-dependent hydrolase (beta-lactamase superfamily II)
VRAVSLHPDVLVVTSALLQVNCVIVRGGPADATDDYGLEREGGAAAVGETFVIDSPVLPDELDALPTLLEQAQFPAPSGLLATHGDWDHLLGRLAFPTVAVGCAESTARRLQSAPGDVQRQLRAFDEELMIERLRPLALGSLQALPVPGRCEIGDRELELSVADGHTGDGMAILIPWAGVLATGDYLSTLEIPTLNSEGSADGYLATLARLRPQLDAVDYVVPGHGPVTDGARALAVLEEDVVYLEALRGEGANALPASRDSRQNRRLHAENVAQLGRGGLQ